jgi:8-oxo-dGTP pyrophosphatase MutT (NUDIX family)
MDESTVKKGISAIIYDKRGSSHYFLVLHRVKGWVGWEFPKGGILGGETPDMAIVRLIKEQAGLRKFEIKGMLSKKREWMKANLLHSYDVFLAESSMNVTVEIHDDEHDNFLWATKERILDKLYWPDEKKYFEEVCDMLQNQH